MTTKASAVISFRMVKLVAIAAFATVVAATAGSVFVKTQSTDASQSQINTATVIGPASLASDPTLPDGSALAFAANPPSSTSFVHPGVFVSQPQLEYLKYQWESNSEPWASAMGVVLSSSRSNPAYIPTPGAIADCSAYPNTCSKILSDSAAAYTLALLYYSSDEPDRAKYAQGAIRIMNAWSATLKSAKGYQAQLTLAWAGEVMPRAAEIIRYTYTPAPGETAFNVPAFTNMLQNIFLPQYDPTLLAATSSNGNWDLAMADAKINIGIFTDNRATFEAGLAQWRARVPAYVYMASDGATPVVPPGGLYNDPVKLRCFWLGRGTPTTSCTVPQNFQYIEGMSQETCRDISHVVMGFSSISYAAESARIQGVDLYGEQQARLTKGLEYAATFDNYYFNTGTWPAQPCGGKPYNSDGIGGPDYAYGWESMYNHYANRMGVPLPQTQQMINRIRPTKATNHTVWETLTHAAPDVARECGVRDTSLGSAALTVNAPIAGTYRVWTLMRPAQDTAGTYNLQVNYGCPTSVGGSNLPTDSYTWVDYEASTAANKVDYSLAAGKHTFFLSSPSAGLSIAKILLVGDPNCVPVGSGDNCDYIYDITPPSEPSNLTASEPGNHDVTLQWTVASDNVAVDHYVLYRDGQPIGTTASTTYTDSSLVANTTYEYAVQAVDTRQNTSTITPALSVTTAASPLLVQIVAPQNGDTVSGHVEIIVDVLAENALITAIDITVDGNPVGISGILPLTLASWDSTTVGNGAHVIRATAYDQYGNAGNSEFITIEVSNPDITPPSTPTGLQSTEQTETTISLTWEAANDDVAVTGYTLFRNGSELTTTDQTTFVDTGLEPFQSYSYSVLARDAAGNASPPSDSITASTRDATAPSIPDVLNAVATSSTSVAISWTASSDAVGVTGYDIYRDGNFLTNVTNTTYEDSGLTSGVTYAYQVKAVDQSGNRSELSQTVNATTPDVVAPSAPGSLVSTDRGEQTISLSWGAATDNVGVIGYVLYRGEQQIATTAQLAYIDTDLSVATAYSYNVRAVDAGGNISPASDTVTVSTVDLTAPSTPQDLTAFANSSTSVQLAWSAATDNVGVVAYDILRNGLEVGAGTTETTYTDSGLQDGQTYTYSVRAKDAAGNISAVSPATSVTTPDNSAPDAPSNVVAAPASGTSIDLQWTAATDNVGVVGYVVYRDDIAVSTVTGLSFTDTGLQSDTTHVYTVRALDAAQNLSPASLPVTATTTDTIAPSAPSGLSGYAVSSTQTVVSWTAATDNVGVVGYRISRAGTVVAQISGLAYTDSSLVANTTYDYSVSAVDGAGNVGPSVDIQISTLPASPVAASGFAAAYFNNTTLSGPAVLSRTDASINFTWGSGSPGPGVSSNSFSVRWTGRLTPTRSGTYTFYTDTDDGVRLWVNGTRIINKWNGSSSSSATFSMTAGTGYDIRMEYFDATGSATAKLSWKGPGISTKTVIPSSVVSTASSGLSAWYYANEYLTGSPTLLRQDANINFAWGSGAPDSRLPSNNFGVRWTGKLIAPSSTTYTLYLESAGGVRLWGNNQLLIDNWAVHGLTTDTYTVTLTAGNQYDLRIEYRDGSSAAATAKLYWSYGSVPKSIVPASALRDR